MRHFHIDEIRDDGRGYARSHVWYQRHFWSWTGPVWPICWLLGHKATLRWNSGMSYVECARCPGRPFDVEGMKAVFARLDRIRPGRDDYQTARAMQPPTVEEEAFVLREISRRGAWSQSDHEFKLEMPLRRRPRPELSLRFHIGGRGSETPWDGHLTVLGSGVYWGLGLGGHLAERITRGQGRDIGVSVHSRKLWWQLWDTPGEHRHDQPRWWSGAFSIDPTEWLWGRRRFTYDKVGEPAPLELFETAEGTVHYDVVLQLEHGWAGWEKRPRPRGHDRWSVGWSSKAGIPVMHHDWKGDEFLGGSVALTEAEASSPDWPRYAAEKLRADMTRARLRYEWSKERWERSRQGATSSDAR